MKQRKNPQGTMVMFLETDLEKSKAIATEDMSEVQKQIFLQLSKKEQEKILTGYGAIVGDLETGRTICKFNMDNYHPPKEAIERFARSILPDIQEFYSHEENRKAFEQKQAEDKKKKK